MDPAPSLGCSLKDVKWSPVAMPLDLLVSTYRLPQIARLDSGECLRDAWVPLGRGEAAAAAVAGSRGGKSRSWTRLGLELPGGCGTWALCQSRSRLRLHSTHPKDPTPPPFPWGWVSSPPSLFPWRPGPCPSSPSS